METLESIFYNPKEGYLNVQELFKKAKEKKLNVKYKDVKQWYDEQPVNQLYKKPPKIKQYN